MSDSSATASASRSEKSTPPSISSDTHPVALDEKADGAKSLHHSSIYDVSSYAPLAPADSQTATPGYALLRLLRIKRRGDLPSLDAIATPESVYDGPHAHLYVPANSWENSQYFDATFRWTYREQKKLLRKTDLKILLWTMMMWLCVNIVRSVENVTIY